MKNYISRLYIIFFAILFVLPPILYPLTNSADTENLENRNMAEKPAFSLGTIATFPTEYENYYNDNLPFRSYLIRSNALLNFKVFKQSPEKKVIIGNDGWLFYNPPLEDSDPLGQCSGDKLSDESLDAITNNLRDVSDTLKAENREFIAMLCPNKECVYGEVFLPSYYNADIDDTMGDQLGQHMENVTDVNFVYPKKSILNAIKSFPEYDFYYKLDTHWNYLGGYIAAKDLFKTLDITLPEFNEITITSAPDRYGDLANMSGIPEMFVGDLWYNVDGYTQDLPQENPDIANVTSYVNDKGNGKSVLVIRDSFTEGLYPYLNSVFSEVNYIHITEYYSSVIEECNPDIVILQVVERYMTRFGSFKLR